MSKEQLTYLVDEFQARGLLHDGFHHDVYFLKP